MAVTPSNMLPLGSTAPDFNLLDVVSGKMLSLQALKSDVATVIMFICNHCPFVQHIQNKLAEVAKAYGKKGIAFIAINSNDIEGYPEDAPPHMKALAQQLGYTFPYLYDETQAVAKAYDAACTPDFFVFDKNLKCVYRGQFDDARLGNELPVTGKSLCQALDDVIAGKPISVPQKPSIGCNIKWKK